MNDRQLKELILEAKGKLPLQRTDNRQRLVGGKKRHYRRSLP